jgi:hypothetical protein
VICNEDCKLDLDGQLREFMAFFVTPDTSHHLIATFESGSKSVDLQGAAGEKRVAQFSAPPPPLLAASSGSSRDSESSAGATQGRAPLPPLATWIALGVTAAVGAATIVSGVDARAGVPGYEKAATAYTNCRRTPDADCKDFESKAGTLLKSGQSRELRTNVLIGVTAAAAVGTAVIAIFFTDWSGDREKPESASMRLRLEPRPGGVVSVLEGQF